MRQNEHKFKTYLLKNHLEVSLVNLERQLQDKKFKRGATGGRAQ